MEGVGEIVNSTVSPNLSNLEEDILCSTRAQVRHSNAVDVPTYTDTYLRSPHNFTFVTVHTWVYILCAGAHGTFKIKLMSLPKTLLQIVS